jgi:hypothetical protein
VTLRTCRLAALLSVVVVTAAACGISIRRDLSAIAPGRIGYNDLCDLQRYFDEMETPRAAGKGPRLVLSVGAESSPGVSGGRDMWSFQSRFSVRQLKKLLRRNWSGLPQEIWRARRVRIEVEWVNRAGIQRVVTGKPARLIVGGSDYALPPHPCLSDLLYGAALYRARRETLGLPPPMPDLMRLTSPDAGSE